MVSFTIRSASRALDTSATSGIALPPARVISPATSLERSSLTSTTATLAPSLANSTAEALPIPEPAPVTSATLPSSLPIDVLSSNYAAARCIVIAPRIEVISVRCFYVFRLPAIPGMQRLGLFFAQSLHYIAQDLDCVSGIGIFHAANHLPVAKDEQEMVEIVVELVGYRVR